MSERSNGRKLNIDFCISIAMIGLSVATLVYARTFPEAARRFPSIACYLLMGLSVILLIRSFTKGEAKMELALIFPWASLKYALITFVITGVYIYLMENVSFFIATALFVPAMMVFMRVKNKWAIVLSTAGTVLFCWFMFVNQLNIRMP